MRILYFTRDYTPHDHRFLTSLAKTSHKIYYLRLERQNLSLDDRPLPSAVEQVPWKGGMHPVHWQDGGELLNSLRDVISRVKPDLIHAGPIQKSALLAAAIRFHPLVSMSWGSDLLKDSERNTWWRLATRYTLKGTDILLGDCQAVRSKAMEFGFPDERIVLFPWGIDLTAFSPASGQELRRRLGWENDFVLLSLRSWEPIYGVDHLVHAFVRAARKNQHLKLLLLGNGSQAGEIHQIISKNQLEGSVYFGGQVSQSDLPRFYHAADLYLSASHSDGSSVSLMEALGCGCPVLVSDIPGNREWITPGQEGWLFSDGDETSLADGILHAAQMPSEIINMRSKARVLAEERADWSKNFKKLVNAYTMAVDIKTSRKK